MSRQLHLIFATITLEFYTADSIKFKFKRQFFTFSSRWPSWRGYQLLGRPGRGGLAQRRFKPPEFTLQPLSILYVKYFGAYMPLSYLPSRIKRCLWLRLQWPQSHIVYTLWTGTNGICLSLILSIWLVIVVVQSDSSIFRSINIYWHYITTGLEPSSYRNSSRLSVHQCAMSTVGPPWPWARQKPQKPRKTVFQSRVLSHLTGEVDPSMGHGLNCCFCRWAAQSITASLLNLSEGWIRTPTSLLYVANNRCFGLGSASENQWQIFYPRHLAFQSTTIHSVS